MAISTRIKGKRGILFSVAAILMVTALSLTSETVRTDYSQEASVVASRLISLNSFSDNVIDDLEIALYTSSFRALIATQDYMGTTGVYLDNADSRIRELMNNGTLYGQPQVLMINNTLQNWTTKITQKASEIGLDVDLTVENVSVFHEEPWNITFEVEYTIQVSDARGTASYQSNDIYSSKISILGFLEPFSLVQTNNTVVASINITPYDTFPAEIDEHVEGKYFREWSDAPDFLMRLEGNFNASPHGIERLLDKWALSSEFVIDADASAADYVYWSTQEAGFDFTFPNKPPFFKLDNRTAFNGTHNVTHLDYYNLSAWVQ